MSFTPTTAQLELLAELEIARMPVIADRLGVDGAIFKAWSDNLAANRDYVEPPESVADILRTLRPPRREYVS